MPGKQSNFSGLGSGNMDGRPSDFGIAQIIVECKDAEKEVVQKIIYTITPNAIERQTDPFESVQYNFIKPYHVSFEEDVRISFRRNLLKLHALRLLVAMSICP